MRRIRALWVFLLFSGNLADPAVAQTPVEDISESGYHLRLIDVPAGLLVDFYNSQPSTGTTRVSLARSGEDITEAARFLRPIVRVAYEFFGISESQQCRFKAILDIVTGTTATAYTTQRNDICPELKIRAGKPSSTGPYTRLAVIRISEKLADLQPADRVTLTLSGTEFSNRAALSGKITNFLRRTKSGLLVVIPRSKLDGLDPLLLTVHRDNDPLVVLRLSGGLSPLRLSIREVAVALGGLLIFLIVLKILLGRKKPLRTVLIGYGDAGDISIGDGGNDIVARFSLYEGSRIQVQSLSKRHDITINDRKLKHKAWASPGDQIRIDGKLVHLT